MFSTANRRTKPVEDDFFMGSIAHESKRILVYSFSGCALSEQI